MHPAVSLIDFYRRHLSPYKGFQCAHRIYHGDCSCSQAVREIVITHGLFSGLQQIRQRFRDCNDAAIKIRHAMTLSTTGQQAKPTGATAVQPTRRSGFFRRNENTTPGKRNHHCGYADCMILPLDCGTLGFEGFSGCEIAGCLAF